MSGDLVGGLKLSGGGLGWLLVQRPGCEASLCTA